MNTFTRHPLRSAGLVAATAVAGYIASDGAPYPARYRRVLDVPLPTMTPTNLARMLQPQDHQVVVDIGCGTGVFAVAMAPHVRRVVAIDLQQEMVDGCEERARRHALHNVTTLLGDAQQLPLDDEHADASYFVTSLGEVPNLVGALGEAARVTRVGGAVVVAEFADRHYVSLPRLLRAARSAGLRFDDHLGTTGAYMTRMVKL